MSGASIVIYFGRGRGYPSPYTSRLDRSTQNGFGLNPKLGVDNSRTRYLGEAYIRGVSLARNAAVLLHRVPYAAGSGEPGALEPSRSVAQRRVDNYGAGFLAAGAAAVITEVASSPSYYIRSILGRSTTLGAIWRAAPTANDNVKGFASTRTPGARGRLDPVLPGARYRRSIVGWLGVTTATVRAGDQGPTTPTPDPIGLYGSGINADSLNNSVVGGPDGRQAAYRFRATTSSTLIGIRVYLVGGGSGYSGGTGGVLEITVQEDDGSAGHVPSGRVLASTTVRPGNPISIGPLPLIAFASPPTLEQGRLYHIVFRNVDTEPRVNYVSVNGLFTFGTVSAWQPRMANTDWANLIRLGAEAWSDDRGPGKGVITPILALSYGNGHVAGVGYMEVWVRLPKTISGTQMVRQIFTVSGRDRGVTSVAVRLRRVSGTSPLHLRLETPSGGLVTQVAIPAASIPSTGYAAWATAQFSATQSLAAGRSYRLVLTTQADTTYSVFVIRKGSAYGFPPTTYFADGYAQHNPGTGWVGFDQPGGTPNAVETDLQFFLR